MGPAFTVGTAPSALTVGSSRAVGSVDGAQCSARTVALYSGSAAARTGSVSWGVASRGAASAGGASAGPRWRVRSVSSGGRPGDPFT